MNTKNGSDIPMGFGMALMQNPRSYVYFAGLNAATQQEVIDRVADIDSKEEMEEFVASLPNNTQGYFG